MLRRPHVREVGGYEPCFAKGVVDLLEFALFDHEVVVLTFPNGAGILTSGLQQPDLLLALVPPLAVLA